MPPIVTVIAPGMMGSAVAGRLTANGVLVRTSLTGRSDATVARARAAGMTDATDTELVDADFILSIVPPGEALALAERLAPTMRDAPRSMCSTRTVRPADPPTSPTSSHGVWAGRQASRRPW